MSQQSDTLRLRLQQLRASRQSSLGAFSSNVFTPVRGGGLFRPGTILQPIVFGEELALVRQKAALCLGKIGSGGNICLKLDSECTTETHSKKKGVLPNDPCLVVLKGDDKGYEDVVLEVGNLEDSFISELMDKMDVNWPSEFAKILANDTRTTGEREIIDNVLATSRKHRNFASPAKRAATDIILDKISLLEATIELLADANELQLNDDGEVERSFGFDSESYAKFTGGVFDKLDIITENARVMGDIVMGLQPFVEGNTKPIENLVDGLRIEFASLEATIGKKDLVRRDVPPCLWSAIKSGFDSIINLDKKLAEVSAVANEAHEVASEILTLHEGELKTNRETASKPADFDPEDVDTFLRNLNKPKIIDGNLFHPSKSRGDRGHDSSGNKKPPSGQDGHVPSESGGGMSGDPSGPNSGCDVDPLLCGRCMVRFHDIESRLTSTNVRVGNLEDSKNGNIESAIMMKDRVYRGRADVRAELDRWFPESDGKRIDAGLFPTPHLILNLIHADICSKQGPKIPIDQNHLIKLQIRRSDADAFFALQSDKPEFMIGNESCPNFSYKATKAQREAASIRFLPSHEDFGNGLDSDSLHYKFKQSLDHIQGERERYIESRLMDHPDHKVMAIAKQLLNDSCKFVKQMLSFMDEIYAACFDSFGATTEAWDLVCHCIEEIFTKELKPCLKYCVAQDLVEVRDALIGVVHTAFSLNCKVKELTRVGLKNHHSTTTSHVRFVMKMAKSSRKADASKSKPSAERSSSEVKMQASITALQKENKDLKTYLQRLESKLDSVIAKNDLEVGTKSGTTKRSRGSSSNGDKDDENK